MISGDMLFVFLQTMEARIDVILKFSSVSCYLNIMSCTDREHWPDSNQLSVCHAGLFIAIVLLTIHFLWQCNPKYGSRVVFFMWVSNFNSNYREMNNISCVTERSCQIRVILHISDTAWYLLSPRKIWGQCNPQFMLQSNFSHFFTNLSS